ncbi:hypothetical protein N0V94_004709 [Neodidymelliopsis sp. IMI 364377]|nr:hypothetical protein N0V94_004709 [Neodidymelliopsis sp. IMI 364377]
MKINEHDSIITPRILLVPYSAHHVPTYHEWMQDEEIQKATASEPLTLDEEYSMQRSWREDADKLTFIVCTTSDAQQYESTAASNGARKVEAGREDAPEFMIGDVNLFLYDDDDDDDEDGDEDDSDASATRKVKNGEETPEKNILGELEIMIASQAHRGQGLAQETLRAFMAYIQSALPDILAEYSQNSEEVGKAAVLKYLRVKIDKDNVRSLALFERLGFVRMSAEPNYFGEVELRTSVVGGKLGGVERKVGLDGVGMRVRYVMGE